MVYVPSRPVVAAGTPAPAETLTPARPAPLSDTTPEIEPLVAAAAAVKFAPVRLALLTVSERLAGEKV